MTKFLVVRKSNVITFDLSLVDRDLRARTPLHDAAENGATEVIRYWIQKGVDVMAQDKDGQTPLHLAARNGLGAVLRALLEMDSGKWVRLNNGVLLGDRM